MHEYVYWGLVVFGVFIAGVSQVMLKISADKKYARAIQQYLNPLTIIAYFLLFASTICTVVAYKVVPLSLVPVWNAIGYINVTILSLAILKERPSRRKIVGLCVVILGILIFAI